MRLVNEAKNYKTAANAEKALGVALAKIGKTVDNARFLIAVNSEGRFVPVVVPSPSLFGVYLPLIHLGVSVVG